MELKKKGHWCLLVLIILEQEENMVSKAAAEKHRKCTIQWSAVGARLQSTRNQMSFITHNQMRFIVVIMQEFSTRETWHTAASCSKFGGPRRPRASLKKGGEKRWIFLECEGGEDSDLSMVEKKRVEQSWEEYLDGRIF
jgi:hypothetical protein